MPVRLVPMSDRAIKLVNPCKEDLQVHTRNDYKTRLLCLGVDSLEIRRLRQDMNGAY